MKTIKLKKVVETVVFAGETIETAVVGNWPFAGGRDFDWGQGHRCRCGNQRFLVCHRIVDIPPDAEGGETIHLHECRNVCGQCIRFHANEMIYGEIDYATMEAVVYDEPRSPTKASQVGLAAMNRYVPVNTDNFDIDAFDLCQYVPCPIYVCEPASEVRTAPTKHAKRGPKGKIRASGPKLAGFEDQTETEVS
jgi:hypothetical protein